MRTWQERHKPLPKYRCTVKGCLEPARWRIQGHLGNGVLTCDGHLNFVGRRHMMPDDCLMVTT